MPKEDKDLDFYEWNLFDGFQLSLWYVALYVICNYFGFWYGLLIYTVLAEAFS